jgi:hypothetical protein
MRGARAHLTVRHRNATAKWANDLPVGRALEKPVQYAREKYFASQPGRNIFMDSAVPPQLGAFRDRHGRGVGCGGRGSVLRATGLQGG